MTHRMTIADLHARVQAIFLRAGMNEVQAAALARVITAGERDACKSHGIYRIEGALRTLKAGKVRGDAIPRLAPGAGSAIVRVDAQGGFANPAFELGLPVLAERARDLADAVSIATALLEGRDAGARRDMLVLNAAVALVVAGHRLSWRDAAGLARDLLDSRRVLDLLHRLVEPAGT